MYQNGRYITNPYPNDSAFLTPRCFLQDDNQQNGYAADGHHGRNGPDGKFQGKGKRCVSVGISPVVIPASLTNYSCMNEAARWDPDRTIRQADHNRPLRFAEVTTTAHQTVHEPKVGSTLKLKGKIYNVTGILIPPSGDPTLGNAGVYILLNPKGVLVVQKQLTMVNSLKQERAAAEKRALKQIAHAGGQENINRIYESIWERGSLTYVSSKRIHRPLAAISDRGYV